MINKFSGTFWFLSNFYPVKLEYKGLTFLCLEAAFQAQKFLDIKQQQKFQTLNGAESRRLGRRLKPIRKDWNIVRLNIMEDLIRLKFSQPKLSRLLLETKHKMLVETNNWNDAFWGMDIATNTGQNHLGKILMKIRSELQSAPQA